MTAWSLLTPYMTTAVAAMKGHMGLTICESRVFHIEEGPARSSHDQFRLYS
jgi:hypothetical protein